MATGGNPNLRVRISADLADIKQGLGLLRGELAKVKQDAERAKPDAASWGGALGKIRTQLGNLAGAYVGIRTITAGIQSLFSAVDRADRIEELAQITGDSAEQIQKLAYAAKFSGVEIDTLSKGVTKLGKDMTSSKGLLAKFGISVTDSAGKSRSASEVLKDLADVFAQLPDGVEKNALAAKIFGDRIGPDLIPLLNLGRKGLDEYGEQAEKTGNVMSGAAVSGAAELNDQLDRLKLTFTGIANETVSNLLPGMSAYAKAAADGAENTGFAADAGRGLAVVFRLVAAAGIIVKNVIEAWVNVNAFLVQSFVAIGKVVGTAVIEPFKLLADVWNRIRAGKNPLEAFSQSADRIQSSIVEMSSTIGAGWKAMSDGVSESVQDIKNVGKLFDETGEQAAKGIDKIGKATEAATAASKKLQATVRDVLDDKGKEGTKKKVEQLAASTALLQDELKRAQEQLDQRLDDKQISITDYYARRVELQRQLIELQIEQLAGEHEIEESLAGKRRIEEQIAILQRDRMQVAVDAARAEKKALEEANKERREALDTRFSAATGVLSAEESSISAQVTAGSIGMAEGERRLQQVRQQSLQQLKALRAEQAAYLESLSPENPEYAEARQSLLGIDTAIANITASMQLLRQGAQDAGVNALTTFFANLRDGAVSAGEALKQLVLDFVNGLYAMAAQAASKKIVGAISGVFSGGEADASDTKEGAQQLQKAAVETTLAGTIVSVAARELGQAAQQLTVAAAALTAANATSSFAAAHGGGIAGDLQLIRHNISASPALWGAAPRYHGGGVAGLDGDEIPAILKRGEVVRTRQQERALAAQLDGAQGGARAPVVRNVVVFDEQELADALSGTAGEKVVVTHVRRNRAGLSDG